MDTLQLSLDAAPWATGAILLCALLGAATIIDRALVVLRSRLSGNGRPFIERIVAMVQDGQVDEALGACSATHAILPDIGLVVLRTRLRDERDLEALADAAIGSTTPKLTRRLRYLPALAGTSVLFGLAGLLAAAVEQGEGGGQVRWNTLAPLATGCTVAAFLVVGHGVLANQIDAIKAQAAEFTRRLVNALLDRPDVRLGHR